MTFAPRARFRVPCLSRSAMYASMSGLRPAASAFWLAGELLANDVPVGSGEKSRSAPATNRPAPSATLLSKSISSTGLSAPILADRILLALSSWSDTSTGSALCRNVTPPMTTLVAERANTERTLTAVRTSASSAAMEPASNFTGV